MNPVPTKCPACDAEFPSLFSMLRHMKVHGMTVQEAWALAHGEPTGCQDCGAATVWRTYQLGYYDLCRACSIERRRAKGEYAKKLPGKICHGPHPCFTDWPLTTAYDPRLAV